MKNKNRIIFLSALTLLFATLACNAALPSAGPAASPAPTIDLPQPATVSPTNSSVPYTEAEVPRIDVQKAKAALDSGAAVIVDVRSPESYADGHAAGAINIPLGNFESDLGNVPLKKDQWIITYCT